MGWRGKELIHLVYYLHFSIENALSSPRLLRVFDFSLLSKLYSFFKAQVFKKKFSDSLVIIHFFLSALIAI